MMWRGVFVATVTPFSKDGAVDLSRYREHLDRLALAGVQGFVPCGTTGEASTLTGGERRRLIELSVEAARAKSLKVIAGCGGNCTESVLVSIREAKEAGVDAALVVTPYYNKPTQAGLLAHYRWLADKGGLPLFLYNVPGRTGVSLSLESIAALFEHPQIVGLKEASGQYGQWLGLASTLNLGENALLAGDDDAFAVVQALGGCGIISAAANVVPEQFVALHQACAEGRWEEAFRLQKRLYPLVKALFLETNPAPVKCALEILGKGEAHLRLPLVRVTPPTEKAVRAALSGMEYLK